MSFSIKGLFARAKASPVLYILKLVSVALGIATLFYVFNSTLSGRIYPTEYWISGILLTSAAAVCILSLFITDKRFVGYVDIIASVLFAAGSLLLILGSILSVIDYFYGIVMWGDSKLYPYIVAFTAVSLVGWISSVAVCFVED